MFVSELRIRHLEALEGWRRVAKEGRFQKEKTPGSRWQSLCFFVRCCLGKGCEGGSGVVMACDPICAASLPLGT